MKIIATDTGRVVQLVVMEEIRPPSGIYMPALYQAVSDRYGFVARPQDLNAAITSGAKFNHGRLITPNKTIMISEIGIYNDGVIIDSLNTNDAEIILEDFISWTKNLLGLRDEITKIPRTYSSLVTVEFDRPIETALRGTEILTGSLNTALKNAYGWDLETNILRFGINADPRSVPPLRNTHFFLERRIGRPYSENRYQSGAPLRTEEHLELLQTIETDLSRLGAD
jgi:hypothetical protein